MSERNQPFLTEVAARRWLSNPRYARYLHAANGDHSSALCLYMWNSRVASAAIADVGHLEVALRNAYDQQLVAMYPDWSIDPDIKLFRQEQGLERARTRQRFRNKVSRERIEDARRGLGATPTHGEVVAALTFGFWASLTLPERTPLLWNPILHKAFPPGTRRSNVHDLVSRVVKFRNRLAHNEPVFSTRTGFGERLNDVRELLTLIDPEIANFISAQSTVPAVLADSPVRNLIQIP